MPFVNSPPQPPASPRPLRLKDKAKMPVEDKVKPYSFYEVQPNGKYLFFVDASLLKSFSSCEAYFYLKHVKDLRQKGFAITKPFPMAIGSWWSDVMKLFYNALRDRQELSLQHIQDIALSAVASNNLDACAAAEPDKFA